MAGDMRLRATMERATRGVRGLYHICPNMSPDEGAIGRGLVSVARSAGVQHFVYHSVLHPQTEAMPHHWLKLRVEELLFESGLAYTIFQPAAYMQNVLVQWGQIIEQGVYGVPYAAETRLSMVDLEDVAKVAAIVLNEPGHVGATYELAGPDFLSQDEIATILADRLRRPVRVQVVSRTAWKHEARVSGLGEYQVETLVKMFEYYEKYGFMGNSHVLGWLLDHPPTDFSAFAERTSQGWTATTHRSAGDL